MNYEMKEYGHISKTKKFRMMNGESTKISDLLDGAEIEVTAAALVTIPETDQDPEKTILYLIGGDGVTYSTISGTVMKTFAFAVGMLGTHELTFRKVSGKSKNGRTYIDFELVGGNYDDE